MQTQCSAESLVFERAVGKQVVTVFDGGAITSDRVPAAGVVGAAQQCMQQCHEQTGEACREFVELPWRTQKSWGATRRVAAKASAGTIRLKLLKIGAVVTFSVRRIKVALASGCPQQENFRIACHALQPRPPTAGSGSA